MKLVNRISLILVLLLTTTVSCKSQNKEEMNAKVNALLGNIYKDVQYQDKSINYQMQITIGGCAFQVLVNDLRVHSDPCYDASRSVSINCGINNNILRSGTQTWEVRVYPPNDKDIKATSLSERTAMMIRVNAIRYNSQGVTELVEPMYLLQTPEVEKNGEMLYADAGKPMMVYKGTFEAKVPYKLTGWSKSKDLRKMDQEKLLDMLVKEYKQLGSYIKDGELDKLALKLQKSEQEIAQSLFYTENDNKVFMENFDEIYGRTDFTVYPIEDYKMTFWGDGRMVSLEKTDHVYFPALIVKYFIDVKGKQREKNFSYRLFFHIPEGSDQLEIIR